MPVANARMYSATPAAKRAWKAVLSWALARAELAWDMIDFDAPEPLSDLWAREDLGCVMMCGLPYSQRRPKPVLIAAPILLPARYSGRPIYFTDIVVRADSPAQTLEDTFGGVVGYTLEDSMSGCIALRCHLLPYRSAARPRLYRESVGGLVNARRVIEAIVDGRIDIGPLDSYFHDLLRAGDPAFAAQVRVLTTTPAAPIPPLVATAALADGEAKRLRGALMNAGSAVELAPQRALLLLAGFTTPEVSDYNVFDNMLSAAREYPGIW